MEAGKRRLAGAASTDEVKELRREVRDLKEVVAEQTLELRLLKKVCTAVWRPRMRYPTSEKLEIIRLIEGSHLPARLTLTKLCIPRTTFYRWYDRYLQRGDPGCKTNPPNQSTSGTASLTRCAKVVRDALKEADLSPRELAVSFTDKES